MSDSAYQIEDSRRVDADDRAARLDVRRRVVDYYAENQFFYDLFWTDSTHHSMNYGYWNADTFRLADAFGNQNRAIASQLRVMPDDRVLEAGCGTGGASVWIARKYGSQGVGITLCPKQANRAREIAVSEGVGDRVAFSVMDYTETAFPDESFSKVFASESVCYAEPKMNFLREAHRLLRPGGRLVVVDGYEPVRELPERERRVLSTWAQGWAVRSLSTVDAFASDLRALGFRRIEFTDNTARIIPSARRILARGLAAWPLAYVAQKLGVISHGKLEHVRASIHQYSVWRKRIALHGVFSATKPA